MDATDTAPYTIASTDICSFNGPHHACHYNTIMKHFLLSCAMAAILATGFHVSAAWAQSPPLALPPLPGAPKAPTAPSAPNPSFIAKPATTENATTPAAAAQAAPKPTSPDASAEALAPPAPNESADSPIPSASNTLPPPVLNLEGPVPALPAPSAVTPAQPSVPMPTPLPVAQKPKQEAKKQPAITWTTTLAPSIVPPRLGYNYRRFVLPSEIYSRAYTIENQHLPMAQTREDYGRWFLQSVARNDIDAARAFLNSGVPVDTANENGETALALAERYGAEDTARLLIARGAR